MAAKIGRGPLLGPIEVLLLEPSGKKLACKAVGGIISIPVQKLSGNRLRRFAFVNSS